MHALLLALAAFGQEPAPLPPEPEHGGRPERLLVRGVHVIDGGGTPVTGPRDLVLAGGRIEAIGGRHDPADFDAMIDGAGLYAIPGLINAHGHLQDERGGRPMPFEYQLNLWLAAGITTIRDLGSERAKALELRERSAAGEIPAPRIFLWMVAGGATAEAARASVREAEQAGADGLKIFGLDRAVMHALMEEAHALGLPVAHHASVAETDARDDVAMGTTTIEHWYGIPDAALPYGSQSFPAGYNYSNELDRFRWAGRLWKEVDDARLSALLQSMADAGVAWNPTLAIYEACRDLVRAQNQPWFDELLHPAMEGFFEPSLESHGSFFLEWTTEDEVEWRRNYQRWFAALREFAERGGTICAGEDAGFLYRMHGFGLVRELELQQEAGFHPIDVLRHATANSARVLGREDELGRIAVGYRADLALVDGNPLADFKRLYPTGTEVWVDGERRTAGGVRWTIKDGIAYRGDRLLERVREIVREARRARAAAGAQEPAGG